MFPGGFLVPFVLLGLPNDLVEPLLYLLTVFTPSKSAYVDLFFYLSLFLTH
ncbi:hypothetical protein GCM10007342_07640 [Staphylococcus pragensis]|nr:hypothetical protein GCM10007342_07640 [Staphylococcus pragensis]